MIFRLPGFQKAKILFITRRHWVYHMLTFLVLAIAIVISAFVIFFLARSTSVLARIIVIIILSIYYLSLAGFAFSDWLRHNYEILMLTSEYLVEADQETLLNRRIVQLSVKKITNVSADMKGFLGVLLKFGDLTIELEGEKVTFPAIPDPINKARSIIKARNKKTPGREIIEQGTESVPSNELTDITTKTLEGEELQTPAVSLASKERLKTEKKARIEARVFSEELSKAKIGQVISGGSSGAKKPKSWFQIFVEDLFGRFPPKK